MQLILGWLLIIFPGILFVGQLISSLNFELAQKLGLQEKPETADAILQRAERYTAYWHLVTLVWLPLSGFLMIINHPFWPYASLIGGAIYFDASGREAAKILSFKHEGINTGTTKEQKLLFATYIIMAIIAVIVIAASLDNLL